MGDSELQKIKVERIWHNYEKWEDFKSGLYGSQADDEKNIKSSYTLLSSPYSLFVEMVKVTGDWQHAAEFNLSNRSSNRRAWLGWSACCYHHGATDDETKAAWRQLDKGQQERANAVATAVIDVWEQSYYKVKYAENTIREKRS